MAKIKDIFDGIRYRSAADYSAVEVNSITDDSRKVKKGGLFTAVRGRDTDGHKFIGRAVENGAGLIVAQRSFSAPKGVKKIIVEDAAAALRVMADNFYRRPSTHLNITGVTGTNGKTTITYIIENILKKAGRQCGVIGTVNYRLKGKEMPSANTTPGPLELQSLFSQMLKKKIRYAVMEVSSHSLDQDRAARISFDVGIFTNITKEHLDYHKNVKNYFEAKAKLFGKLKINGTAVLNNDDPMVASLKRRIRKKRLPYPSGKAAPLKIFQR